MRKLVAAIVLLCVFSSSSFAQVKIKKEHRVGNISDKYAADKTSGMCGWACTEMLGRHLGIKSLDNLLEKRSQEFTWEYDYGKKQWYKSPYLWENYGNYKIKELRSPATHQALSNKLSSLNVKYTYQNAYNYDKSLLKQAIKNNRGCLVVVYWWKDKDGKPLSLTQENKRDTHAIILLDYKDNGGIEYLDPNDITTTYTATNEWFNYYWTGYVLVLENSK